MDTRVIRLTPDSNTTSFEEAFGEHSSASGKRAIKKAARKARKEQRAEFKAEHKQEKLDNKEQRKENRYQNRQKRGSMLGNILTGGVLGATKALKNKRAKKRAEKEAEQEGGDQGDQSMDQTGEDQGYTGPDANTVNQDVYAQQDQTGDYNSGDQSYGGGSYGGSSYDDSESEEPGEDMSEDGGADEMDGMDNEDMEGIDGSDSVNVHPKIQDLANKVEWHRERITRLRDKASEANRDLANADDHNSRVEANQRYADILGEINKSKDRIKELGGHLNQYSSADGGKMKDRIKHVRSAFKKARKNRMAHARGVMSKDIPVDKELNPDISHNQIVVPANEQSSGADGTGLYGLDAQNDYDAQQRVIEIKSNASGAPSKKTILISIGVGVLIAGGIIFAIHHFKKNK